MNNSTAFLRPNETGSKTEVSILQFIERCGYNYEKLREKVQVIKSMPFNSSRKRMGLILVGSNGNRLVEKGASELILEACSHYHSYKDGVQPIQYYKSQIDEAIV